MAAKTSNASYFFALARISLGLTFLWAFFDKLMGLGYATKEANSWLNGGSPTTGYLSKAAKGPFADFYHSLAGQAWVDWMFMLGLLGIGIALTFGIFMQIASWSAAVLLLMMWSSVFPPANNPFIDDHIVYMFTVLGLSAVNAGDVWGLGAAWSKTELVKDYPFLR